MTSILLEAEAIVNGPRAADYGDAAENWANAARIASAITGLNLEAVDLVLIMMAVKLARLRTTPNHHDSIVDMAGYAEILSRVTK